MPKYTRDEPEQWLNQQSSRKRAQDIKDNPGGPPTEFANPGYDDPFADRQAAKDNALLNDFSKRVIQAKKETSGAPRYRDSDPLAEHRPAAVNTYTRKPKEPLDVGHGVDPDSTIGRVMSAPADALTPSKADRDARELRWESGMARARNKVDTALLPSVFWARNNVPGFGAYERLANMDQPKPVIDGAELDRAVTHAIKNASTKREPNRLQSPPENAEFPATGGSRYTEYQPGSLGAQRQLPARETAKGQAKDRETNEAMRKASENYISGLGGSKSSAATKGPSSMMVDDGHGGKMAWPYQMLEHGEKVNSSQKRRKAAVDEVTKPVKK